MKTLEVGERIYFLGDWFAWTVRAVGPRFVVCTKPYRRPVEDDQEYQNWYTIIDTKTGKRGPHNLIGGPWDFLDDESCEDCLRSLESGEAELSRRSGRQVEVQLWTPPRDRHPEMS